MINIIIPMCGHGQAFIKAGYVFPKPLVEVIGKPLIQIAVENLRPESEYRFTFVVRKEHSEIYSLKDVLSRLEPDCQVVEVPGDTSGPACSVLLGASKVGANEPVLIANSDQYINFNINDFLKAAESDNLDGLILTFDSIHPKWSYVALDDENNVIEAVEKKPISRHATAGIYYFRKNSDLIESITKLVQKNVTFRGEFFVCPSYNEMILSGRKIGIYEIESPCMHALGTPEELSEFEKHMKGSDRD